MMRVIALIAALVAVLSASVKAELVSLSFQVDPQKEECFYEEIPQGAQVDAKVLVYRGGKLDIKMRVEYAENKEILFDRLLHSNIDDTTGNMLSTIVKKGTTFVTTRAGLYTFCFDNRMARWTAKVMTVDLDITDPNSALMKEEKQAVEARNQAWLTGSDIDPKMAVTLMRAATNRIHNKLLVVENDQMFHYHREKRHRGTLESTNTRVQWYSLFESLIVVSVAIVQVFLVQRWFADDGSGSGFFGSRSSGGSGGLGGSSSGLGSSGGNGLLGSSGGMKRGLTLGA